LDKSCAMGKAALLVIVMCLAILGSTLAKPENTVRQTRPSKEHLVRMGHAGPVRTKRLSLQLPPITIGLK
ncbi:hypothetical protein V3C99_007583, partial [Haemonchus contortus]